MSSQSVILKELSDFFDSVLSGVLFGEDKELLSAPTIQEILQSVGGDFDTEYVSKESIDSILSAIKADEYLITDQDDDDLTLEINEQAYSVSYNSPFDDLRSEASIVVNPTSPKSGECKTISEALVVSLSGYTILLKEGIYKESVVIDKCVEIRPCIEGSNVVVEPEINDAFQLQASTARIVGIKISCSSPGDTYCVRSSTGFLEIENCELISATGGCVRVEEGALFKATESVFKSKMHPATNLSKNSRSVFISSRFEDFSENQRCCSVEVDSEATCILIDCHKIDSGIVFRPRSKGMIKGCIIQARSDGVQIFDEARPLIYEGKILKCSNAGIVVESGGLAVIQRVSIQDNEKFGILCKGSKNCVVLDSTVSKSHVGVRCTNSANVVLRNTTITECQRKALQGQDARVSPQGVQIEDGCSVKFVGCSLIKNDCNAIYAKQNCSVQLVDCVVEQNTSIGLYALNSASIKIERSRFDLNQQYGIALTEQSQCEIAESLFFNHKASTMIYAKDSAKISVSQTTFENSQGIAISVEGKASLNLERCIFQKIHFVEKAFSILFGTSKADIEASRCEFIDCDCCIQLNGYAKFKGKIKNTFTNSNGAAIICKENSFTEMSNTWIHKGSHGIEVKDNADVYLQYCRIESTQSSGLRIVGSGTKVFISETIFSCCGSDYCLKLTQGYLEIDKSVFIGATNERTSENQDVLPSKNAIFATDHSRVIAKLTLFSEFAQNAIDVKDNSEIAVSDCMFESIKNAVFTFVNFSKGQLARCSIKNPFTHGVVAKQNSQILISDCSYEKFITAWTFEDRTSKIVSSSLE